MGKTTKREAARSAALFGLPGERPRVVFAVRDSWARARPSWRPGVDIFELRIDRFANRDPGHVSRVASKFAALGRPLLATIRRAEEGGEVALDDGTRVALWRSVLPHVAAIDVEIHSAGHVRTLLAEAHEQGCRVILSYHDFERTPPERALEALYRRARSFGADGVKLALHARHPEEVWRLAAFTWRHREFPVITMSMGPLGPLSRLFLPLLGSRWVYTTARPMHGQIPLHRLLADLRFYFP